MDDTTFARLTADLLDGKLIDWDALEKGSSEQARARIQALRAVAGIAAGSRDPAPRPPERWGGFELIEPVGHGGYGEVWRAFDPQLQRPIALKLLPAEDDQEAQAVLTEGRLLARVRHPNVAAVYGASRIDGEIGVAMEFIDGDDLDAIVRRDGPLPGQHVVEIGLQLSRALEAVHRAGVLHRDVKASNVKRTSDGRVILLDFGSSRELLVHTKEPIHEAGTPLYLAPEVLHGRPATIQSDLYSVGVLLHYLATGRYPVEAQSLTELRNAHAAREMAGAFESAAARLPSPLAGVIHDTLAIDPALRPPSAAAIAARLSQRPRHHMGIAIMTVLATVAVAGIVLLQRSSDRSGAPPGASARRLEWSVAPATIGRPSHDGRVLPFIDRRNGALSIMTIDSGAIDTLIPASSMVEHFVGASAASDDGSRVAYAWRGRTPGGDELRVITADNRTSTTLWRAGEGIEIQPAAWSRDGRQIAGVLHHAGGASDVFTITAGSPPRVLATGNAGAPSFHDDGRLLAFQRTDPSSAKGTMWIADTVSGAVTPLLAGADSNENPTWVKSTIVFISERSGARMVWAVNVKDPARGTADGAPWPLSATVDAHELLGATADGSVIYRRGEGTSDVIVSALDGSGAQQISSGPGTHVSPDWSSDGHLIAWIREPPVGPFHHDLQVRDLRTGRDQTFGSLGASFGAPAHIGVNPRLSPDGRRVLLRAVVGFSGFFVADLETGKESRRYLEHRNYGDVEWDDDSNVFFLERDRGVSRMNLTTGAEERVYSVPHGLHLGRGIALTPDRTRIAFVVMEGPQDEKATIMVTGRDGTALQALFSRSRPAPLGQLPLFAAVPLLLGEWTADGAELLFAATDALPSGFVKWDTDLWALPKNGGPPRRTGLSVQGLRDMRSDPAGRRVVYTSFAEHVETWILRGALAKAASLK